MTGPVALKDARQAAGVTQAELARRSRLSVRTVRGLETGSIRSPHQRSLVAVARALEMSEPQIAQFLGCWSRSGSKTFTALVDAGQDVEQLLADRAVTPQDDYEDISIIERHWIGPDRRSRRNHSQVAMRALEDGFDRRLVMWVRDNPGQDLDRIGLHGLHNCLAGEPLSLPNLDLVAFELTMGRVLEKGATHVFSYGYDFSDTYPDALPSCDTAPVPTGYAGHGFRRPLQTWVLQVDFECQPPGDIWYFRGSPRRRRRVHPLEVDAFGSVHITGQNVAPGEYGIAWEW